MRIRRNSRGAAFVGLATLTAALLLPSLASAARFEVDLVVTFSDVLPVGSELSLAFDVDPTTPNISSAPDSSLFADPGTAEALGFVFPIESIFVRRGLWRLQINVIPMSFDEIGLHLGLDFGPQLLDIEQPLPLLASPWRGEASANIAIGGDLIFVNTEVEELRFVDEPARLGALGMALAAVPLLSLRRRALAP